MDPPFDPARCGCASEKVRLMESLCALFDHIDLNSEGHISWSEFYSYIVESGLASSSRFTFFKSEFKPAEVVTRRFHFGHASPCRLAPTCHAWSSPHIHWFQDRQSSYVDHACHICTGTGPVSHSAPGLGSPLPHRRRNSAHRCHACTKTGLTAAASAPGLVSPLPHHRGDWGRSS
jgi:hypothetical protein